MKWFSEPVSLSTGFAVKFILSLAGAFLILAYAPRGWEKGLALLFWIWIAYMAAPKDEKIGNIKVPVTKYPLFVALNKARILALAVFVAIAMPAALKHLLAFIRGY